MEGLDLIGLAEAGIDVGDGLEGTDHQAGADEEHESERDLHDDENAASAMLLAALAIGAAALADAGAETHARVFKNGNGAEKDAGENGDGESEEEDSAVDADFVDARDAGGGDGDEGAQTGESKPEANGAAEQTENETFEEKFAGDAIRAGAECGTDGKFLAAAFDADEEKIGDVGAGDEQDHADGCP